MSVDKIFEPVKTELRIFKQKFKEQLNSRLALVDKVARYLVNSRGKNLRPALVLLSSKVCKGEVPENSYRAAITIELIHTATLVHDDVVDGADMRRSLPSINAIWNNKIAVLMGDYLLANALISVSDIQNFEAMKLLSQVARRASEGELLQIDKSRKLDIDESTYFKMISDKTGALIAAACELGALTTTQDPAEAEAMRVYGEHAGIAFQIKDDLFDYEGVQKIIGKNKGRDLKEQHITLPLIYALKQSSRSQVKSILSHIRRGVTANDIRSIIAFTREHGGLDYAKSRLEEHSRLAVKALDRFNDSAARQSLLDFVHYNKTRSK